MARPHTVPTQTTGDIDPDAAEAGSRPPLPSIIGTTVVMKGELTVGEDLEIEGTFDGTITGHGADTVTVRRTARLSGEISASVVRVEDGTNLENAILSGSIRLAK